MIRHRAVFTALLLTASSFGCGTYGGTCSAVGSVRLVNAVMALDWSTLSSDKALEQWPDDLAPYDISATPDANCKGMLRLRRLDEVVAGLCHCCVAFEFERYLNPPECANRLTGIVIELTLPSERAARDAVSQYYRALAIPPAAHHSESPALLDHGTSYQWERGSAIASVTSRIRTPAQGVWHVRIEYLRDR
jgi:hypothetical protein